MTCPYDKAAILRFINSTINRHETDPDDQRAAAIALLDYLSGVDLKQQLGMSRKPGARKKVFDPDRVYVDDPLFGAMMDYVAGKLSYSEIKRLFRARVPTVGERTIESYIAAIKPRAAITLQSLDRLRSLAR